MIRSLSADVWFQTCLCGALALSVAGCGGPPAPKREYADVTGKVTYKNAPVKMGQVLFQPSSGVAAFGELSADGNYSLKGEIGPNTVMVISRDPEPDEKKSKDLKPPKSHVPPIYGTPASPLKFDVKAGTNKADFDLQ